MTESLMGRYFQMRQVLGRTRQWLVIRTRNAGPEASMGLDAKTKVFGDHVAKSHVTLERAKLT